MIVEVLQGIYKSPLVSSWVECVNPCGRINRTQGFAVRPIRAYRCEGPTESPCAQTDCFQGCLA